MASRHELPFRDKLAAALGATDRCYAWGWIRSRIGCRCRTCWPSRERFIEATSDLVCAFKPQSAFFEALGADGWGILRQTIAAAPDDIPVILDVKRGDIAHTAEAYAEACFERLDADAVTLNPYLGADAVAPFLTRPERGRSCCAGRRTRAGRTCKSCR